MDLKIGRLFKRFLFVIEVTLSIFLASCHQKENKLGIQLNLDRRTLSNGLVVILVEDHSVPVVSYQTMYRVGSVDEYPGITGISHLFEHFMFKGTEKYGTREFFLQLESKGAEVNAFTSRDYTVFYETFSPFLLEKVIDMESDRMANLVFTEEKLKVERVVVLEERRLRMESSPDIQIQEALWGLAYRAHPYHWPTMGFPGDLFRMTVDQLNRYYKSHYHPGNAALVVVGNFKSDFVFDLIKKYYGKIPSQKPPERNIPPEPKQVEERRLVLRDRVSSERFSRAYRVTSARDDDSYVLDVLSNILFEGTNSRAYRALVDELDLATSISGSAFTPTYPGLFIMNGVMKEKLSASKGELALDQVIQKVQNNGVTQEEVQIAVKQLTVQMVDSIRTPYGLGQLIGTVQMVFGDPQRFTEDLSKYTRVTQEDIRRVANQYLHPNNRSVVTLVPVGTSK